MQQWALALDVVRAASVDDSLTMPLLQSALWACRSGGLPPTLSLLRLMGEQRLQPQMTTYLIAAPDSSTEAEGMMSLLKALRQSQVEVDLPKFTEMLMHVSSDEEWERSRACAADWNIPWPSWRLQTRNKRIGTWFDHHRRLVTVGLLGAHPHQGNANAFANYKALHAALLESQRSGKAPDFSDAGARWLYVERQGLLRSSVGLFKGFFSSSLIMRPKPRTLKLGLRESYLGNMFQRIILFRDYVSEGS